MKDFNAEVAQIYDEDIRKKIIGYDVMQELILNIFKKRLRPADKVLVIGCGTGAEILRLESMGLDLNITGIDPSQEMLNHAQTKVSSELICTSLEDYSKQVQQDEKFDCVVTILVSHFIKGSAAKDIFFQGIKDLIKPTGFLVGADLMDIGLADYYQDKLKDALNHLFFPLTNDELELLLVQKGFSSPLYFFNSLGIQAFLSDYNG